MTTGPKKRAHIKSFSANMQMNQAIEAFTSDNQAGSNINFTRGPEIEITTRQDVEHLKALLSQVKLNVTT